MFNMKTCFLAMIFAWICSQSIAGEKNTISGYLKDAATGEELIGATILIKELSNGTTTNLYGFYSLTIPAGHYTLVYSYIGFGSITREIELNSDLEINIELSSAQTALKEIVVTGEAANKNVESVEMSAVNLQMNTIKEIPALMGEVDVIKAIQLLPGVQTVGEGSSGFYVRGGGVDQNMILLDEAPVYNASHLLGFFSVFNQDAIKGLQLYKGGIPASYGGRLSSVLDIRLKEGNSKKFTGSGGIGSVSSRATVEGPLKKDKSSFIISGRRTYMDVFFKALPDTNLNKTKLFFYDLNTKINYKLNEQNRIYLSGYFGRDVMGFGSEFESSWGNATGTVRWNHVYNKKLFSNLTLLYSKFDYSLGVPEGVEAFIWESDIQNVSAKLDYNYFLNPGNSIQFGLQSTYHIFNPGKAKGVGPETIFNQITLQSLNSLEHAIYLSNEQKLWERVTALYGLRFSAFQNIGEATVDEFEANYDVADSTYYEKGEIYNTYAGLEPRLGLKYSLSESSSVKLSYNRMRQYIHLASNSTSSSPLDIWFPSSPNVKPQIADQVALGYFRNFKNNMIETSIEAYYKKIDNAVDFKDHAELLLNPHLEGELRFGKGKAYGMEFLVRKQEGKLTGWVSYTLSRTEKIIPEINQGNPYPAKYDKTHDISLVLSYRLSTRWLLGMNWIYTTGAAITVPTGRLVYANTVVPVYSDRNGARMPAYHRLDLSATLKANPNKKKRLRGDWVFSVYNAYYRKNPYSINFRQRKENPNETYAEMTYLFPILPAVTYNFKF